MFIAAMQSFTVAKVWKGMLSELKKPSPAAMSSLLFLRTFKNMHSDVLIYMALSFTSLGMWLVLITPCKLRKSTTILLF
jgi:hypothetical protein